MRRIALVCDWYHPRRGGIEAHLDGLATRLTARGHSVIAITSTPGPAEVSGVRVHRLDAPTIPLAGVAAFPVARDIETILKSERIDVVHAHVSIVAPTALAGALAAQRLGLPAVLTFHSFVPFTPLLAGLAGWVLGASRWRAEMTAVSGRVAREVEAFAPGESFSILPNAIDTTFWTPAEERNDSRTIRLVYAGRLQAKKRPLLIARVLRELGQNASGQDWHLTVAGDGPFRTALVDLVRDLGFESRVNFVGWVEREQLRQLLRASHVFLSTAERESFGLAALEARACGAAVVAVEDSAVADFITHEVSGLLATTNAGFASAVARLVRDAELRERIREFNRRTLIPYGWDRAIEAHEAAYKKAEDRLTP